MREVYLLSNDNQKITGMMIYYYFVCKRKLWFFCKQLTMEQYNEDVKIGKIIDETTYDNEEKHIEIDGVINIDFIKEKNIIHEVKKSKKIEQAGIWQVKYYLYYLKKKGVVIEKGIIDYPLLKKNVEVNLTNTDEGVIKTVLTNIEKIRDSEKSPMKLENNSICQSCAYYDLCYI